MDYFLCTNLSRFYTEYTIEMIVPEGYLTQFVIGLRRIQKTEFEYSPPKILLESEYSHYIYVYI